MTAIYAVTACTGVAGSQVLAALLKVVPPSQIRCIVRAGTEKKLGHLQDCESVHHVDFMDPSTITKALDGCTTVYLNSPPSLDVKTMRDNMANACAATSTLKHIVLLSEAAPLCFYGLDEYWDDHKAGEDAIQKTGIPMTVVHPGFFQSNFTTHFGNPQTIKSGNYFNRVGTVPVAYTHMEDLGDAIGIIMTNGPDKHGWKRYTLISETLTGDQAAQAISLALGRTIEYRAITVEEFRLGMEQAGVPERLVVAYSLVMDFCGCGRFDYRDHGILREMLGRPTKTLTETIGSLKDLLSEGNDTERATNK